MGYAVGAPTSHGSHGDDRLGETIPSHATPTFGRAVRVAAVWLPLWLGPVVLLLVFAGWDNVFSRLAVFFSEVAVVTFGGAYAVLAYVAQEAVGTYHWVSPGEMLAGLGMAETTPGPLIMVRAVCRLPRGLSRARGVAAAAGGDVGRAAGHLGDVHAVLPLGVPRRALHRSAARRPRAQRRAVGGHRRRGRRRAEPGGVVRHPRRVPGHCAYGADYGFAIDLPVITSINPFATILAIAAALALFRFKIGVIPTLLGCSIAGVLLQAAFGGVH